MLGHQVVRQLITVERGQQRSRVGEVGAAAEHQLVGAAGPQQGAEDLGEHERPDHHVGEYGLEGCVEVAVPAQQCRGLLEEGRARVYHVEVDVGEPFQREIQVVEAEGAARGGWQPQCLVHRDVADAEVAGGFQQRGGVVGVVEPPAPADIVVEEGGIQLQPVDAELGDLLFQLGDRGVDRGEQPEPVGVAVPERRGAFGRGHVAAGESEVGQRVDDREVDRALDEQRVGDRLEGEVGEELVVGEQVLGTVLVGREDVRAIDRLELIAGLGVLVRRGEVVGMHHGIHHDGSVDHCRPPIQTTVCCKVSMVVPARQPSDPRTRSTRRGPSAGCWRTPAPTRPRRGRLCRRGRRR